MDQVARPQQQVDEVDRSGVGLQPAVTVDRFPQLGLQPRREVGVGDAPELLEDLDDLPVLLQHLRACLAGAVQGPASPGLRADNVAVAGELHQQRLDAVVVAAARPDRIGLADLLHDGAYRLHREVEPIVAVLRLVREVGELHQVRRHLIDHRLARKVLAAPRPGEVAPLGEGPGGPLDAVRRAVAPRLGVVEARPVPAAEGAADALGRIIERRLQPVLKRLPEELARLRLVQHRELRIDPRLDRPFTQQVSTEAMDRRDLRFFEMGDRLVEVARPLRRIQ